MDVTILGWAVLIAGLVILLLLDLFVFHRGAHEVPIRMRLGPRPASSPWPWCSASCSGCARAATSPGSSSPATSLEMSLSLDNVFVWALIFSAFSIPRPTSIACCSTGSSRRSSCAAASSRSAPSCSITLRLDRLHLRRAARPQRRADAARRRAARPAARAAPSRLLRRYVPTTQRLVGAHLFVRESRHRADLKPDATPLSGRLVRDAHARGPRVVELSDIIFAVDSIPAIFGVTREPFIVFSATALALLGLRSLYFLLAGARDRFVYLDVGLAVILMFVGAKFILTSVVHIPIGISLLVIFGVMGVAIAASIRRDRSAAA